MGGFDRQASPWRRTFQRTRFGGSVHSSSLGGRGEEGGEGKSSWASHTPAPPSLLGQTSKPPHLSLQFTSLSNWIGNFLNVELIWLSCAIAAIVFIVIAGVGVRLTSTLRDCPHPYCDACTAQLRTGPSTYPPRYKDSSQRSFFLVSRNQTMLRKARAWFLKAGIPSGNVFEKALPLCGEKQSLSSPLAMSPANPQHFPQYRRESERERSTSTCFLPR